MKEQSDGLARYEQVDKNYLKNRKLRKSAGWILLWALGVGAVISGDFYGWHFGLAVSGFWGLAIATLIMAAMYVCIVFSIAELSAAGRGQSPPSPGCASAGRSDRVDCRS